jgi:hypothetical protein
MILRAPGPVYRKEAIGSGIEGRIRKKSVIGVDNS